VTVPPSTPPAATAVTRRTLLSGPAGATAAGLTGTPAAAQQGSPEFGGRLDGVSNYEGVLDRTGRDRVTVAVGAESNGGNDAFGPAAVRVNPGTTVVWEWTDEGSLHNVVAEDGTFGAGLSRRPDTPSSTRRPARAS
jgi:plastocyanin